MSDWTLRLLNLAAIGILAALAYFLRWTGPEFALGLFIGFLACYTIYKNWRKDYEDEKKPHFTD